MDSYLKQFIKKRSDLFIEMEELAAKNRIPIMTLEGMELLLSFLKIAKPKKVLEIGTAIGYSALRIVDALPEAQVITLERNPEMISLAKQFITRANQSRQVTILSGDAITPEIEKIIKNYAPFDAIFIDGAKAQYKKFFNMYEQHLTKSGLVFSDNIFYKDFLGGSDKLPKRQRRLVEKISEYNEWLRNNSCYDTSFFAVGDGLAVSLRKD